MIDKRRKIVYTKLSLKVKYIGIVPKKCVK